MESDTEAIIEGERVVRSTGTHDDDCDDVSVKVVKESISNFI